MNIAIIGAGASGLAAAVAAAPNASLCVYEQKNIAGKKLLATGNGKCNLLNEDQDLCHFHSRNPDLANNVLSHISLEEIKSFFAELGILTISKNGYLYPMSEQAKSVQTSLVEAAKSKGVKFEYDTEIISINRVKSERGTDAFKLTSSDGKIFYADCVILSTGTRAGTRTNINPGIELAKSMGHSTYSISPALCALRVDSKMCKYWQGVRTKAKIELLVEEKIKAVELGELMLTDYGVSGIPAFQLSGYLTPEIIRNGAELVIDWLPLLSTTKLAEFLDMLGDSFKGKKLSEALYGILPAKLSDTLVNEACHTFPELKGFKSHLLTWNELTPTQKNCIISTLKNFKLRISGLNDFENAQVCAGGIPLTEINTDSCMSKICDNLFITGEILDVNGDCGGYNLQWAWTTGILAGQAAAMNK